MRFDLGCPVWRRTGGLVAAAVVFAAVCGSWPVAGAGEPAAAYVEGIEALDAGEFSRAVARFDRAVATDEENTDYLRARGVAHVLAEQFSAALADLQRVLRLNQNDRETRLWLAAAYRMSGDPATGAQYFTYTDLPKEYANLVYNLMAMDYLQSRNAATRAKQRFPEVAYLYAQRHWATGPAANALVTGRMKAALDRGDWIAALGDLRALRRTAPDDAALRGAWAQCLIGLGDAWHARREFTHTLCLDPVWAAGYVGRAQAAALLGDLRRANADAETAAALGASPAVKHLTMVPDAAVAQFTAALDTDITDEALVDKALAAHRWFNARRLRYDEAYQDRIWALTDAARRDAKNTAWPEALARFLYHHHVVPTVWNGPRATEQLRPQSKAEHSQELQRALDTADVALQLDSRNVNAIATKAEVYYTLGNSGGAERLADQGLSIDRRNLRLLRLKGRVVADRAAALTAQARALRAGHDETHTENRSDGVYRITTHYSPTAAELAQAASCDAQAAEYRRQAEQLAGEARQVELVTLPALIKDGETALGNGNVKAAGRAFEEAARCDPDRAEVVKGLTEVASRRGDARAAKAFGLLAQPLDHTAAASQLKTAWDHVVRTAWKSAGETLDAAAQIDPTDARVPAYRAIVDGGRGDAKAAARQRRAALALEEARARLMGTSFLSANAVSLRVDDVALPLAVRGQQGDQFLTAGDAASALTAFKVNAQLEPRFDKLALIELAPTALLPDPTSDPSKVPESPSLASLLAWAHLGEGRALLALSKPSEAMEQYRTVIAYDTAWPATAPGRETLKLLCGWAQLGLAEAAVAAKDYDAAMKMVMDQHIVAWGLPAVLEQRRKALQQQITDAGQRQYEEDRAAEARLTPRQRQMRALQNDIAQLQKQRDGIQRDLDKPDLSARDKEVLRNSVAELDRFIAARKTALSRLENSPDESAPPVPAPRRRTGDDRTNP